MIYVLRGLLRITSQRKKNDIIITLLRHIAPTRCIRQTMAGVWFRTFPPEPENNIGLNAQPGPKEMPPTRARPIAYFFLLCHINLIREIVRQTNRYVKSNNQCKYKYGTEIW